MNNNYSHLPETMRYFKMLDESFVLASEFFEIRRQHKIEKMEKRKKEVKEKVKKGFAELLSDLKCMYNNAIFSDIEISTSTKTFRAHKNILSARSPVFRSMFSNGTKEKSSGRVEIVDLEDDTIRRMLLYIYTNSLEGMQFGSASKLYAAADKYRILSLRSRCASFLKENLLPTNACDVLVLADLHHDDDLKTYVQDYILEQQSGFFCSQGWKNLMKNHLQLAADLMREKICQE